MKGEIDGRRIIVTGAAGGIGAAVVQGFAESGARLAGIYNNTAPGDDIARLADWHACDLTDQAAVDRVFRVAAEAMGGLDALINVAGMWRASSAEEVGGEDIDFILGANVKSAIFTNQAAFRLMKDKGGRIVNFGSVEGVEGNAKSPVYASAKGAVHAWTRSAALSWAKYGVTVNAIAPAMETRVTERLRAQMSPEQRAQMDAHLRQRIPIDGKMGDPLRDCVPVLAFLAGDGSRFMTGQLLSVDGGLRMLGA